MTGLEGAGDADYGISVARILVCLAVLVEAVEWGSVFSCVYELPLSCFKLCGGLLRYGSEASERFVLIKIERCACLRIAACYGVNVLLAVDGLDAPLAELVRFERRCAVEVGVPCSVR